MIWYKQLEKITAEILKSETLLEGISAIDADAGANVKITTHTTSGVKITIEVPHGVLLDYEQRLNLG